MNDLDPQQHLRDTIKEQIRSAFLRVEKLERQLGYSTNFLPPVDPEDTDAMLASLRSGSPGSNSSPESVHVPVPEVRTPPSGRTSTRG